MRNVSPTKDRMSMDLRPGMLTMSHRQKSTYMPVWGQGDKIVRLLLITTVVRRHRL